MFRFKQAQVSIVVHGPLVILGVKTQTVSFYKLSLLMFNVIIDGVMYVWNWHSSESVISVIVSHWLPVSVMITCEVRGELFHLLNLNYYFFTISTFSFIFNFVFINCSYSYPCQAMSIILCMLINESFVHFHLIFRFTFGEVLTKATLVLIYISW